MTSSEYRQHKDWTSGYVNRPFEFLLSNTPGGAKRVAQGAFSNAGLTMTHVLTLKSTSAEMLDNLIENTYREWLEFEEQYQKRKRHRLFKTPEPYIPAEYLDL